MKPLKEIGLSEQMETSESTKDLIAEAVKEVSEALEKMMPRTGGSFSGGIAATSVQVSGNGSPAEVVITDAQGQSGIAIQGSGCNTSTVLRLGGVEVNRGDASTSYTFDTSETGIARMSDIPSVEGLATPGMVSQFNTRVSMLESTVEQTVKDVERVYDEVDEKLEKKANASHTHAVSDISGLKGTALDTSSSSAGTAVNVVGSGIKLSAKGTTHPSLTIGNGSLTATISGVAKEIFEVTPGKDDTIARVKDVQGAAGARVFSGGLQYGEGEGKYTGSLNELKRGGIYYAAQSSGGRPDGVTSGGVVIVAHPDDDAWVAQTFIATGAASTDPNNQGIFQRTYTSGSWTAWKAASHARVDAVGLEVTSSGYLRAKVDTAMPATPEDTRMPSTRLLKTLLDAKQDKLTAGKNITMESQADGSVKVSAPLAPTVVQVTNFSEYSGIQFDATDSDGLTTMTMFVPTSSGLELMGQIGINRLIDIELASKAYVDAAALGAAYTLPVAGTDTLGGVKVGADKLGNNNKTPLHVDGEGYITLNVGEGVKELKDDYISKIVIDTDWLDAYAAQKGWVSAEAFAAVTNRLATLEAAQ